MRFSTVCFLLTCLLWSGAGVRASESRTQEVAARLSAAERQHLRRLSSLRATTLSEMDAATAGEDLRREVEDLFESVPLSLSLRPEGARGPQEWLRERLRDVDELTWLGELREEVPVPVELDEATTLRDRQNTATRIEVGDLELPLQPFWPNGALPTLTPEEGLSGRLVDVGDGEWEDVEGLDPRDAVVLMNFKGGRNWNRMFELGAKAVVVVEDEYVSRPVAERFYANTPLPIPRFFVDRAAGRALRDQLSEKNDAEARVVGGNWMESRTARSLFAWLPPHPEQTVEIRDTDLLSRIAAQFGVELQDLLEENNLQSPVVDAGKVLDVPGRLESYTVVEEDLLTRLVGEFGLSREAMLEANPGLDTALPPGTRLRVPALEDPLVLQVRLEAASSLPGLPHGGRAAANIVAAARLLETAADMPEGTRRRGVLVAFLEGDVHGGRASRRFLESYLLEEDLLDPALVAVSEGIDQETIYENYLSIESWLDGKDEEPSAPAFDWFVDQWLASRLDQYRVALAEARVEAILSRIDSEDEAEKQRLRESQSRYEAQINRVVEVREATLQNAELSSRDKASGFLEKVDETLVAVDAVPALTRADLEARFRREVEEERTQRNLLEGNRRTVRTVMDVLYSEERPLDLGTPLLGYRLDVSTGSPHLQLAPQNDLRKMPSFRSQTFEALVERMDRVQSFAAREAGWDEPWSFIGNNVQAVFPLTNRVPPPSYSEFWAQVGVGVVTFQAANDSRNRLDTPRDVPAEMDFDNLARLLRTMKVLVRVGLENAGDGDLSVSLKERTSSRLMGMTTKFNVRSGIDAKDPVPSTLVRNPSIPLKINSETHNTAAYMGTRLGMDTFSRLNGRYSLPVEFTDFSTPREVYAYRPDEQSGLFQYVFDAGQIGTQKQAQTFTYINSQDTYKNLILYELYPFVISAGVDPLSYAVPRAPGDLPEIIDAVLSGTPRHVNVEHPFVNFRETELTGLVVYMEPGRRVQMVSKRQGQVRALLLGPLPEDPEDLEGLGIEVGPKEGDRNLVLPLAPVEIAQSMFDINERRLTIYERYGIRSRELSANLKVSRQKLEQVEDHVENLQWQDAYGRAREAWGVLAKGYPSMLKLGREAVLSVVILMALLAPTGVFLERLVIGSKHIIARLGGAVAIFVLGTVFLNFFHPAFKIAASPFIVVIAFTMILMAVVVLGICYQRFEVLVRRARIEGGEAESEEISLVSTLNTAFSLGVSNLKKRPTRTLLTAFTVTVLTFSIVSFVSVRGKDTLFLRPVPMDLTVGGIPVGEGEIEDPAYEGALFREFSWAGLSSDFMNAVETEFGSRFPMAKRMHYIEGGGWQQCHVGGTESDRNTLRR